MNQAQLFAIDNSGLVARSNDKDSQAFAKVARLESQLIKEQKRAAKAEEIAFDATRQAQELNRRLLAQSERIADLTRALRGMETTGVPGIPSDMWRRLIQLCHPDKHGGSEAANNATQWLNKNRP